MALQKSTKIIFAVVGFIFIIGVFFLFFNDYGIIKFIKLNNQVSELQMKIKEVEKENRRLQAEIDSLQNNIPAKIEKVAREKYNMMRQGESKVNVEEK